MMMTTILFNILTKWVEQEQVVDTDSCVVRCKILGLAE